MSDESGAAPKKKKKKQLESGALPTPERRREIARSTPSSPRSGSATTTPPSDGGTTRLIGAAVVALAIGGAAGWFIRDARANAAVDASPDPAASGGPAAAGSGVPAACADWAKAICDGAGATSEACEQATGASALMSPRSCVGEMAGVKETIERIKANPSPCASLVSKLCADLGPETQTCKMVQEKTPEMPGKQCTEMLKSYDRVLDELKEMEKQNAPIAADVAAKQAAGDVPSFGPADAKVVVVEYSDFECPYCSQAAKAVHQIKEKYSGVVRFVFRQYPLPFHDHAQLAAEASLAAYAQGPAKFWAFHDKMFENQRALERADLEKYAEAAGLDMAKFKKALDDHTYADAVKADMKLAGDIGVSGTPTMIVGTERVPNPTEFEAIAELIDKQLEAAGVKVPADPAPGQEPKNAPKDAPKDAPKGAPKDPHEGHGHP
jgi:protein-disulfide isomerase